jgi:hypothetical protein
MLATIAGIARHRRHRRNRKEAAANHANKSEQSWAGDQRDFSSGSVFPIRVIRVHPRYGFALLLSREIAQ